LNRPDRIHGCGLLFGVEVDALATYRICDRDEHRLVRWLVPHLSDRIGQIGFIPCSALRITRFKPFLLIRDAGTIG
jgi:hypothetical protein